MNLALAGQDRGQGVVDITEGIVQAAQTLAGRLAGQAIKAPGGNLDQAMELLRIGGERRDSGRGGAKGTVLRRGGRVGDGG